MGEEAKERMIVWQAERITQLEAEVQELRTALAAALERLKKDSHNSSKPPASDGMKRRTKVRVPSGKKTGGQPGHRGTTLQRIVAEREVRHRPDTCHTCGITLVGKPGQERERRQVQDSAPLVVAAVDHVVETVWCSHCQSTTSGAFPASVRATVQYGEYLKSVAVYLVHRQYLSLERTSEVLAEMAGVALSEATLVTWLQEAADGVTGEVARIATYMAASHQGYGDETGFHINGTLRWGHLAGTRWYTHIEWHAKRGKDAFAAAGIWPQFHGRLMHDRWASYDTLTCQHSLCKAHLLRDLTALAELHQQSWAEPMKAVLLDLHAGALRAQARGETRLPEPERTLGLLHYFTLIQQGFAALPPDDPLPKRRGRPKQHPAKNLLLVFLHRADEILDFVEDTARPFTNNLAERRLRPFKLHEKISGGFRSAAGATAYCRLRSYVATLMVQGHRALTAIRSIFSGHPLPVAFGLC